MNRYEQYIDYLKSLKNDSYKKFNDRIIKTKYSILGIKFPVLRKIAKELQSDYKYYLDNVTDTYFEEVFIYGLLSLSDDNYFYKYLDKIDNWALCDSYCASQKFILKDKDKYFRKYLKLLKSSKPYYIRVGLVTLLNFYVRDKYILEIFKNLKEIKSDDYYVLMGESWLLQVMAVAYQEEVITFLKEVKNLKLTKMTIQKIKDSYKFSKDKKLDIVSKLNMV